ncbi:unnamed protein product [Effrenium voratum]|uniref:Uncharacterized protein n=1 Tax=Effrenium voratum TaxID=2562239 RepID=A0AA36JM33_9DINO|nr:unnamed protein product [Effrenium voratum]
MLMMQPFGFMYALTLGKDMVDICLHADEDSSASKQFLGWLPWRAGVANLLVSVDEAEDVVAHVQYRAEYGASAPLPDSLVRERVEARVQWVVCDFLDILMSWHARNRVACDACSLLLQPFQQADQSYAWAARARTA